MLTDRKAVVVPVARGPLVYGEAAVEEPGFGSMLVRVTGQTSLSLYNIPGTWAQDARHHYSKDQPWNDDGGMLWVEQKGVQPGKMILDAKSFHPILGSNGTTPAAKLLGASYELRWRPGHPSQIVSWLKSSQELVLWDVTTGAEVWRVHIPSVDPNFGWISEGTISDDGRYTVLGTHFPKPQTNGAKDYVVVVDLESQRVGPASDVSLFTLTYPTGRGGEIGNINISASGAWVMGKLASTPEYGWRLKVNPATLAAELAETAADGLRMRDAKSDTRGWIACLSHADMNMTPSGRDIVVGGLRDAGYSNTCSDAEKTAQGCVVAIDLESGRHVHISGGSEWTGGLREASDQHTSGRAYRRRGWHLVTYERSPGRQFSDELVLWKTDGSRECVRFGVTRTDDSSNYRAEAHGVPDPDGERVLFATNWSGDAASPLGPSPADVKDYMLVAGAAVPPPPPTQPPAGRFRYLPNGMSDGVIEDTKTGRFVILRDLLPWLEKNPPA